MADMNDATKWFQNKWVKWGIAGVALLGLGAVTAKQLVTTNDAGYYMVIQNPITGSLSWELSPGMKWRGFGKVTVYPQRETFWFSTKDGQPVTPNSSQSIRLRFNDGGHANLSGSISWEMPVDVDHLNLIHSKFRSPEAIDQSLIRTVIEKSVYTAGPMMSSTESYASRRNELLHIVEDQIGNGVYETETIKSQVKDPVTNEIKLVDVVRIKVKDGVAVHAVDSRSRSSASRPSTSR